MTDAAKRLICSCGRGPVERGNDLCAACREDDEERRWHERQDEEDAWESLDNTWGQG